MILKHNSEYVRAQRLFIDWCKMTSLSLAIMTAISYTRQGTHSEEFVQGMHDAIFHTYSPLAFEF